MYRGVAAAPLPSSVNLRFSRLLVRSPTPSPALVAPPLPAPSSRASYARRALLYRIAQERSAAHLCLWLLPHMVRSAGLRPEGRVAFSSGNTGSAAEGGDKNREILVQHLLVGENDLKLLLELQQRAAAGEDLSDLAVSHSLCPSKENGGMLGWVRRGQMVPEFEEAALSAPLNKVIRCKTKFGWHLLQVLSERDECLLEDIDPVKLHLKMQDPNFFEEVQLIDVREPDEVSKASLTGFKVLPLRQFGNWAPKITNEFDIEKDTYVLCHHGMRSLQVARWLQTQGFKRVFNVAGGIHAYALQADASVPTY